MIEMDSFNDNLLFGEAVTSERNNRRCRCLHAVALTLMICLILTSITAIVLSIINKNHYNDLLEKDNQRSGFCVICSELSPLGYVDRSTEEMIASLNKYNDDGVQICCAKNGNEKEILMKLQLKRKDSLTYRQIHNVSKLDPNDLNFGDISAHKVLHRQIPIIDTQKEPKFGDKFYMLHISDNYTDVRYEHVSGVELSPLGLRVKFPGLYFVYKSIFFMPDSTHPCRKFQDQTFLSVLLRNSTRRYKRMDALLRSEHTCCPDCVQNRETTFTGGIFYLDEGDLIQVEVSAYGLVYFKQDVTYLGLVIVRGDTKRHMYY